MAIEIRIPDEVIVNTMNGVINLFLIPKFISLGMNATGSWIKALEGRSENGNGVIYGFDYTYWLVNGRKPGTSPPISALMPWVTAKFGIGGNEAKSIAFAVANKIKAEGTNYYPEGTDLLEILRSPEVSAYVTEQLQTWFTIEISKVLKKQLDDNFS